MANKNLNTVIRKTERGMKIYRSATDTALLAAGPALEQSHTEFSGAEAAVSTMLTSEHKIRTDRDEANLLFARQYDKVRSTVHARMPYAELPPRASTMSTQDDLLNGGKRLLSILTTAAGVDETHPLDGQGDATPTGEPWALILAREFAAQISAAEQAYDHAVAAREQLKKAIDERAKRRVALEASFLAFRRVVHDVYGHKSDEYHRLRDRGEAKDDDAETPPAVVPAPPAMAA